MIFHENSLLADDSHEISFLIFLKLGKMSQNKSSAAVRIDALRVNPKFCSLILCIQTTVNSEIFTRVSF